MSRLVSTTDVLVIGAGVAGLSAALAAAPARVTLLTKTALFGGNSAHAQGGIAAAIGAADSPALHARDTHAAGAGLNDHDAVGVLTGEGPDRAHALLALGARFDRTEDGALALAREAAHSVRRVLHSSDATGAEILKALGRAVRSNPMIRLVERTTVVDLHMVDGRVAGAFTTDTDGLTTLHQAGAVVLATGGSGQLFEVTTNPVEATADGIALAARVGATLRDLEFVQFHPTALAAPGADPLPLVTEALRGEGAVLIDEAGRRFTTDSHPDGDLAPRDVVARAIAQHRLDGHDVYLDATSIGAHFPERFPTVFGACRLHGFDPRTQPIPVSPAAHYHMGGVATALDGRTDIDGLFAAGEVAATGVHGANRLASNSLLEGLVFGARAGVAAAAYAVENPLPAASPPPIDRHRSTTRAGATAASLRRIMWRQVGLVRDHDGLSEAIRLLDDLHRPGLDPQTCNLLLVARLTARAALARTESRGAHQRADFPHTDRGWSGHLDVRLVDGQVVISFDRIADKEAVTV